MESHGDRRKRSVAGLDKSHRRFGPGGAASLSCNLPTDHTAPQRARNALGLFERGLPSRAFSDLRLLVTELITDIISITRAPLLRLEVSVDPRMIKVVVSSPADSHHRSESETQAEIAYIRHTLLAALAKDWGVEANACVRSWVELERAGL